MSQYLLSMTGIILLSAILTCLLPEGKTTGLIKAIMRMTCILAIISPIFTFFRSGSLLVSSDKSSISIFTETGIEEETAFIHYYCEMRISETERALKEELYEKFAVNVEVTFLWEYQTEEVIHNEVNLVKITQIRVKIIEHK